MRNVRKSYFPSRRLAFTLIELLIVVAIIAILAAIAVPNFLEAQVRAKVSRAKTDMRSLATALEAYRVDTNHYPPFKVRRDLFDDGVSNTNLYLGNSVFNPTHAGVSSRHVWLTTPIGYITSVFPEAFAVREVAAAQGLLGDRPEWYDAYDLVNAYSFTAQGDFGSSAPQAQWGASVTSGASWRLASSGPDRIQAYGGSRLSQGANYDANRYGPDYDSSNGTISTGDIVRVGSGMGPYPSTERPYYDRVMRPN